MCSNSSSAELRFWRSDCSDAFRLHAKTWSKLFAGSAAASRWEVMVTWVVAPSAGTHAPARNCICSSRQNRLRGLRPRLSASAISVRTHFVAANCSALKASPSPASSPKRASAASSASAYRFASSRSMNSAELGLHSRRVFRISSRVVSRLPRHDASAS